MATRIIPETILWCTIIFLAFFTRSQYYERIAAYQSPPPEDTRPNFMMSDPTFCMLPYHWMIFSGVMIIAYCINGWSAMMSLDLQYKNAHWLILKNIQDGINLSTLTQSFPTTVNDIHSLTCSCQPVTSKVSLLLVSSFTASHDWCLASYVLIRYAVLLFFSVLRQRVRACVRAPI